MKKHNPTVTIAISAFNEEKNIVHFLKSVLEQKENGFITKKILIVSDGSTDTTAKLISGTKDPRIEVWRFQHRAGKSNRLNQIYKYADTDILVQSDADVVFTHPFVIGELINAFNYNDSIMMCGGNPQPLPSQTFMESAVNTTVLPYLKFRTDVRNGNNIFSADGRLLGFRKKFYRSLTIPSTMIANDAFAYFYCLNQGYSYKFVHQAKVWFRLPQTLSDQIKQNTRFSAAPFRMGRYFPKLLVSQEYKIPKHIYWKYILGSFIKKPVHALFIFFVNLYCKFIASRYEKELTAKWAMARSTKMTFSS